MCLCEGSQTGDWMKTGKQEAIPMNVLVVLRIAAEVWPFRASLGVKCQALKIASPLGNYSWDPECLLQGSESGSCSSRSGSQNYRLAKQTKTLLRIVSPSVNDGGVPSTWIAQELGRKHPKMCTKPGTKQDSSRARKPWSANRELRGWQKRGCREGCQEGPEKGA